MSMNLVAAILSAGLTLATASAVAHHSVSAQFDYDRPFDFSATLTKVEWINPHSYLHFAVTEGGKQTEWSIESHGIAGLRSKGLNKDILKAGETYRIRGFKARNGKPNGFLQEIQFADGRIFKVWSGEPNGN